MLSYNLSKAVNVKAAKWSFELLFFDIAGEGPKPDGTNLVPDIGRES
jgi:hypothetical protein